MFKLFKIWNALLFYIFTAGNYDALVFDSDIYIYIYIYIMKEYLRVLSKVLLLECTFSRKQLFICHYIIRITSSNMLIIAIY